MREGKGGRVATDLPQIYGATEMRELQNEKVEDALQLQVQCICPAKLSDKSFNSDLQAKPAWQLRLTKGNSNAGECGANIAGR